MRGKGARALVPALAVLALVAIVAIAATGSTTTGTGASRSPSDTLLDTIFSVLMLLVIPAAAIFLYGLLQRKEIAREIASGRYRRSGLLAWIGFALVFGTFMYFRFRDWERVVPEDELGERAFPGSAPLGPGARGETTYEPEFAVLPAVAVVALAAIAVAAAYLTMRRKRLPPREDDVSETLVAVLEDTLDDLRAEADPRKAVIAAYARLERALAGFGLPRRPSETAEELLARVLRDLDVQERAIRLLTELYERAKFSQHEVDRGMKDEAIDALERVRDGLEAARVARLEAAAGPHGTPAGSRA